MRAFFLILGLGGMAWIIFQGYSEDTLVTKKEKVIRRPLATTPPGARQDVQSSPDAYDINSSSEVNAEEIASAYIKHNRSKYGLKPYHRLSPHSIKNPLGTLVSYNITQDGIPVVGMRFKVLISRQGRILNSNARYLGIEEIDLQTKILTPESLLTKIDSKYQLGKVQAQKVSPIIYWRPGLSTGELAYVLPVSSERAGRAEMTQVVFRAIDGQVLAQAQGRRERR